MTCWTIYTEAGVYVAYGRNPIVALQEYPVPSGEAIVAVIRRNAVCSPQLGDFGMAFVPIPLHGAAPPPAKGAIPESKAKPWVPRSTTRKAKGK
jgi:hypothetical protein